MHQSGRFEDFKTERPLKQAPHLSWRANVSVYWFAAHAGIIAPTAHWSRVKGALIRWPPHVYIESPELSKKRPTSQDSHCCVVGSLVAPCVPCDTVSSTKHPTMSVASIHSVFQDVVYGPSIHAVVSRKHSIRNKSYLIKFTVMMDVVAPKARLTLGAVQLRKSVVR